MKIQRWRWIYERGRCIPFKDDEGRYMLASDVEAAIALLEHQIGQLSCSVSNDEMELHGRGISVHQRKQQFDSIIRDRLVASCPHELETHCVTEVNGAGVQREYWQQCSKCGETIEGVPGEETERCGL